MKSSFSWSRVACCPQSSRIVSRLAKTGSLRYRTTRRVSDQQPASQPARLTDGRTDIQPGRASSAVSCVPSPAHGLTHTRSHTHTTPMLINHVTCTGSYYSTRLVAAGAVVPLQISHRPQIRFFQCLTCPQLLRFVRPPAQQTHDETSPHWHRTVDCSGAPRKLVEPPNESAVDARLAPSLTNLFMRLRRRAHFLRPPPFLSLPAGRRPSRLGAGLQRVDLGDSVYDRTVDDDHGKLQCSMTRWGSGNGSDEIPRSRTLGGGAMQCEGSCRRAGRAESPGAGPLVLRHTRQC